MEKLKLLAEEVASGFEMSKLAIENKVTSMIMQIYNGDPFNNAQEHLKKLIHSRPMTDKKNFTLSVRSTDLPTLISP